MNKNNNEAAKATAIEKAAIGTGVATTAAGTTTAVAGKAIAWGIFSAGKGAALAGVCETNAFLAWLGGGSLAAGGGGMAAGSAILAAMGPVGWTAAGVGAVMAGFGIRRAIKRSKAAKGNQNRKPNKL